MNTFLRGFRGVISPSSGDDLPFSGSASPSSSDDDSTSILTGLDNALLDNEERYTVIY